MLAFDEVLEQLKDTIKEYDKYGINDKGRWINQGWEEAFTFIKRNYDVTEKTIQQKGVDNGTV